MSFKQELKRNVHLGCLSVGLTIALATWQAMAQPAPAQSTPTTATSADTNLTEVLLKLAGIKPVDVVIGDEQVAIAAVKQFGAKQAMGIVPNEGAYEKSRALAKQHGISDRVMFIGLPNAIDVLSPATVISLGSINWGDAILSKLVDLKPGTRIISNGVKLGAWEPDQVVSLKSPTATNLYAWTVPAKVAGEWQGSLSVLPNRPPQAYTMTFSQQFQKVQGDVRVNKEKVAIHNVKLEGDRLSFSRSETVQGQPMTVLFQGRVNGDVIKGTAELQAGILSRKYAITAKRVKK